MNVFLLSSAISTKFIGKEKGVHYVLGELNFSYVSPKFNNEKSFANVRTQFHDGQANSQVHRYYND